MRKEYTVAGVFHHTHAHTYTEQFIDESFTKSEETYIDRENIPNSTQAANLEILRGHQVKRNTNEIEENVQSFTQRATRAQDITPRDIIEISAWRCYVLPKADMLIGTSAHQHKQ